MKAVMMKEHGGTDVLYIGETEAPIIKSDELLVKIKATALNRADLLQRRGLYPPPEGASPILGLEISGIVIDMGPEVEGWQKGDRLMALLPGGGYAEQTAVPAGMAMKLPDDLSFEEAASIPESFLTAYLNIVWLGGFQRGMNVLVHAGASGVGTAAIQMIRAMGGQALVTAGSAKKLEFCAQLGAAAGWDYNDGTFEAFVNEHTSEKGVNLIIDLVGAPYFQDNIASLAYGGKLVVIGVMGGATVPSFNLMHMMSKQLTLTGTTLRSQSSEKKVELTSECAGFLLPQLKQGHIRPVIDHVYAWTEVQEAHRRMEQNLNVGKIILKID